MSKFIPESIIEDINSNEGFSLFLSVKKTKNCLFSRRMGHKGINLFGYNFYFKITK